MYRWSWVFSKTFQPITRRGQYANFTLETLVYLLMTQKAKLARKRNWETFKNICWCFDYFENLRKIFGNNRKFSVHLWKPSGQLRYSEKNIDSSKVFMWPSGIYGAAFPWLTDKSLKINALCLYSVSLSIMLLITFQARTGQFPNYHHTIFETCSTHILQT